MKEKEEFILSEQKFCQHYDPSGITMIGGKEPSGICSAGVNYENAFGDGTRIGIFKKIPCLKGLECTQEEQIAACPKWIQTTREQAEQQYSEFQSAINRMRIVMPIVKEWRNKSAPFGKQEIIECPICKGRLHLSQSSYNGHVHGCCETKDCVSWME